MFSTLFSCFQADYGKRLRVQLTDLNYCSLQLNVN